MLVERREQHQRNLDISYGPLSYFLLHAYGIDRHRTCNLLSANQVLSQIELRPRLDARLPQFRRGRQGGYIHCIFALRLDRTRLQKPFPVLTPTCALAGGPDATLISDKGLICVSVTLPCLCATFGYLVFEKASILGL